MSTNTKRKPAIFTPENAQVLLAGCGVGWMMYYIWKRVIKSKTYSLPPGDFGFPIVGHTVEYLNDPDEYWMQRIKKFGGVFVTNIGFALGIGITTPEGVRFALSEEKKGNLNPSHFSTVTKIFGKHPLPFVETNRHGRMRRMLTPYFTPKNVKLWFCNVQSWIVDEFERLALEGKTHNVQTLIEDITFHAMINSFLTDASDEECATLQTLTTNLGEGTLSVLPIEIPGTKFQKAMKARRWLQNFCIELLHRRQSAPPGKYHDAFQDFIDAKDKNGVGFTNDELLDNMMALAFAGFDTTASALCHAVMILNENQDIRARVRDEILSTLGVTTNDEIDWRGINPTVFSTMPYLKAVVSEVLRLYPPASHAQRVVSESTSFNGHDVPAGARLEMAYGALCRSETNWGPSALEFNPDRFLEKSYPHMNVPFGCGAHMCIGRHFATLELRFLVAVMCCAFDVRKVSEVLGKEAFLIRKIDFQVTVHAET